MDKPTRIQRGVYCPDCKEPLTWDFYNGGYWCYTCELWFVWFHGRWLSWDETSNDPTLEASIAAARDQVKAAFEAGGTNDQA